MGFRLQAVRGERVFDRDFAAGEVFDVETAVEYERYLAFWRQVGGEPEHVFVMVGDEAAAEELAPPAGGAADAPGSPMAGGNAQEPESTVAEGASGVEEEAESLNVADEMSASEPGSAASE